MPGVLYYYHGRYQINAKLRLRYCAARNRIYIIVLWFDPQVLCYKNQNAIMAYLKPFVVTNDINIGLLFCLNIWKSLRLAMMVLRLR